MLIIMLLASCAGNRKYDDLMQRADSIMNVNDDSAKVAIRMLDGVKPQLPEFSKSQKMRYELLRHKAMNKACITFTSDSVMKEVVDYYDHHGSANERMLANYVLGCVYRDMHEAPMALEYYNKATEQADTTAADCDYATLYRVYSQMGFLFSKQYLPYQELNAFDKAEKYAYLAKDTFNAIVNYQNQGEVYDFLGKKDSVIAINLQAAKLFKKHGNDYAAAIAFGCNYKYYIEKKDFINAKKAFEAYNSTGYEGNSNYEDAKAYVLYQKGTYRCVSYNSNGWPSNPPTRDGVWDVRSPRRRCDGPYDSPPAKRSCCIRRHGATGRCGSTAASDSASAARRRSSCGARRGRA